MRPYGTASNPAANAPSAPASPAASIRTAITVSVLPPEDGVQHKDISVDQVREVEQAVALAPFEGRTRVAVIDPADAMSIGAQNAFLKTLEEPPPNAVFILIATQEDDLLPTVRSRCRKVEFGLVAAGEIEAALLERGTEEDQARLLSRLAEGRPERAIALAADAKRLEKRRELLDEASALGGMPMGDLMDLTERMARQFRERRESVFDRLSAWLSWWRDVLLVQSGAGDGIANVDLTEALRQDAERIDRADVIVVRAGARDLPRTPRSERAGPHRAGRDDRPHAAASMRNQS